jgi:hypothetical protein
MKDKGSHLLNNKERDSTFIPVLIQQHIACQAWVRLKFPPIPP